MYKLLYRIFISLSIFLFICSCSDNDDENFKKPLVPEKIGHRTVLMYVSAQNSLGARGWQRKDSVEISKGTQFIKEHDRLLVYMDDLQNPRIYRYTKNSPHPEIVKMWQKDMNSSSPETLKEVLEWTKTYFPSKEYGLVMWSHSDGWLPSTNNDYGTPIPKIRPFSFGVDVGTGGNMGTDKTELGKDGVQMDIKDMAQAISKSGIHLKFIFFDSCMMQNLESAYDLRNVTEFIIGSPMQIPGCGANYTMMLEKGLFTDAEYDIVDTYTQDAQAGYIGQGQEYKDYGIAISCLRTDEMENLAKTLGKLLRNSSLAGKKSSTLSGTLHYLLYDRNYGLRPYFHDAQEAMRSILTPEDFTIFENSLNKAIVNKGATELIWIGYRGYWGESVSKRVDPEKYSAVSMFIPMDEYTQNSNSCKWGNLNEVFQSTTWYKDAGWAATGW